MSILKALKLYSEEYHFKNCLNLFDDFISSEQKEDSSNLVYYFLEMFGSLPEDFLKELKLASNYYFFSVLATDKLIDGENSFDPEFLLMAIALREDSLHKMYQIIEPSNNYWIHFKKYYKQYVIAISTELNSHRNKITPISIDELENQYSGNSALAKALPMAMAFKMGDTKYVENIEKSIDNFYIGLNLFDDVNDWKEDWKNGNFSYLITQAIINNHLDITELTIEQLGRYIYFNKEALNCLELSVSYYEKALKEFEGIPCEKWSVAIKSNLNKSFNLKEDFEQLISRQLEIIGIKNADISKISHKKNFKTIYKQGIEHIINQSKNGNADTTIHSYFPNSDGFKFKDRYSDGDVFQRAIIIDCLHAIRKDYIGDLSPFFEKEANYLCSQERRDGGWNFYKDLEYQPNDLDSTAQVIQAIIKMNRQNVISKETICAIDMMLKQQNKSNGRIGTWILPIKEKRDQYKEKQYQFIKDYTGHDLDNSIDIDVMANFIYSLFLIDNNNRYKNEIELGIDFIENSQNKNGSWSSTWYWGDYYCTYVCLRLLCELRQKSKTVEKARDFILTSQNENEGWGYKESVNDPLNTAYALISLHYFKLLNIKVPFEKIKSACSYLKEALNNPNEMNKSDFINLRKKKYSTYRSNSVTIAFGLKALSLWQTSTLN